MQSVSSRAPAGSRSSYTVAGLTCGACIAEVMEAVRLLPGVTGVAVDLVIDGGSSLIVYSDRAVNPAAVLACLDRAGYRGLQTGKRRATHLQRTFTGNAQDLDRRAAT